jgi:arginase
LDGVVNLSPETNIDPVGYFFVPQWQGAGYLPELANGAARLRDWLGRDRNWVNIDVSADAELILEQGIVGRRVLVDHLHKVAAALDLSRPRRTVTIGGECSTDLLQISYLAKAWGPDMAVVWIDAHGDVNTPETSPSGTFHGMPLRTLLGEGDSEIVRALPALIDPRQVILVGVRDLDPAEDAFIRSQGLLALSAEELRADPALLADWLGRRRLTSAYLHLDVDVLDSGTFSSTGWPAPDGLHVDELIRVLAEAQRDTDIAGWSMSEYLPREPKDELAVRDLLAVLDQSIPSRHQ